MLELSTKVIIIGSPSGTDTTIIVTHDPEEALTISDKVLIINNGNIEQFGTPGEIINNPASEFVNDFIIKQLTIKKNNIYKLFNEKE